MVQGLNKIHLVEVLGTFLNQEHLSKRWRKFLALPATDQPRTSKPPGQKQHRLSEPDQQVLVEAYEAGESVYTLATRFALHRQTVSAILERHGVRRRYNLLTAEQLDRATELYLSGLSIAKVGKTMGVSPATVHSALKRLGVPMRPNGTNQWH